MGSESYFVGDPEYWFPLDNSFDLENIQKVAAALKVTLPYETTELAKKNQNFDHTESKKFYPLEADYEIKG